MANTNYISQLSDGTNTYVIKDSEARTTLSGKQDTLVSGTSIKTINNESILGSGNITISSGSDVEAYTAAEVEAMWNSVTLQFTLQSQAQGATFIINGVDYCNGQTSFSITLPEGTYAVDSTCGYNNYEIYKLKLDSIQNQLQADILGWVNVTSPVSLTTGGFN